MDTSLTHTTDTRTDSGLMRPLLLFGLFLLGCAAFRYIVIDGTILDSEYKPAWLGEAGDMSDAHKAIASADFAEAKQILRTLIAKQPNYGSAHRQLAYVYLQQDLFELALRHYRVAADYHPDSGEIAEAIKLVERRIAARDG